MKFQGIFRAGSVALTVSMAIMLSGCGVTSSTTEHAAIVLNDKVAATGSILIQNKTIFAPMSMVLNALNSIKGSTIPGAPEDEFRVYATWNKAKNILTITTPRYSSPIGLGLPTKSGIKLEMNGRKIPHSIPAVNLTQDSTSVTYVSVSVLSSVLKHMNVETQFSSRKQWKWTAPPVTSADTWVDETPLFAGSDVKWAMGNKAIGVLTNGASISGYMWPKGTKFRFNNFYKLESLNGLLVGKPFVVTIYKSRNPNNVPLLAVAYDNNVITAFSPGFGGLYPVNFTGNWLVLRNLSNYDHWLTVNLKTGKILSDNEQGQNVIALSGYYHAIPPTVGISVGPTYILGLPQRYPSTN
ncbi:MAG: hypothetical protein ACYCYO_11085 [Bacilli bacterium]